MSKMNNAEVNWCETFGWDKQPTLEEILAYAFSRGVRSLEDEKGGE